MRGINMLPTLTLPQFDQDKKERDEQLERMRMKYAYSLTYNGQIATINELPKCEKPGAYYYFKALSNALGLLPSLPGVLWKTLKHGLLGVPFKRVEDYIFFGLSPFPDPKLRTDLWNDKYMAHQCVAGANPVMVEGVNANNPLPKQFKLAQAKLSISHEELSEALINDRLYMVNLDMLKTLQGDLGTVDGHKKYATTPIALYYLQDDGDLRPLAIQLDATADTSDDNPIITPAEGNKWKLARTCFMAADGAVHDLWTHAVQIHYVMEAIILVTYGQLSQKHPLLALIDPHLQHTLNLNSQPLYERGKNGKVPGYGEMFPPNNDTLVKFMGEGMRQFKFRERALPNDLKRRHVENDQLNYPYRDEGLPMWNAIQKFTREYVDVYYKTDQYVLEDKELQAWAKALGGERANGACGLEDFPTEFTTKQEVAEIFGQIIFTATAHHSSVHFPQYPYSQFVPNMPNAIYQSPTELLKKELDQAQLMQLFPPFKKAFYQSFIYYAVNFKVSRIGAYPIKMFCPAAVSVIEQYQQSLKQVSKEHREKYRSADKKYPYMDPKNIPNSVSS
jgi:arachidonate 15-lipoxygenase